MSRDYVFSQLLILAVILLIRQPVAADVNEWASIGPNGNQVDILAVDPVDPSIVYLVTELTGVQSGFRSADHGLSWTSYSLPPSTIAGLAVDPGNHVNLYAGLSRYIFKSGNSGGSWSLLYTAPANYFFNIFAIDPLNPFPIYSCTTFNGVMKSSDGGSSWNAANTGMTATHGVNAITMDPTDHAVLYLGTTSGVFRSSDYAANWSMKNTGLSTSGPYPYVNAVAVDPHNGSRVYAATAKGVYKSEDGGESWGPALSGLPTFNQAVSALVIDPKQPARLYAGTYEGVYRTTNGGASWVPVNEGLTDLSIALLAIDPLTPENLYAGTSSGLFKITFQDSGLFTLTYGKSGSGSGRVTSSPAGIDCSGSCYAQFSPGAVLLHAEASAGSFFMGWSGACSGLSHDCTVNMNGDKGVGANFVLGTEHMVMLEGGAFPVPYFTLQSAYDKAGDEYVMKAMETTFIEELDCNGNGLVTIEGGYDESFSESAGYTTIVGTVTIGGSASVVAANLIISGS